MLVEGGGRGLAVGALLDTVGGVPAVVSNILSLLCCRVWGDFRENGGGGSDFGVQGFRLRA